MFGPETGLFGPETEPIPAPIELEVPPGWLVAWEISEQGDYKLKAYPLDIFSHDKTYAYIEGNCLEDAQAILDGMIGGT